MSYLSDRALPSYPPLVLSYVRCSTPEQWLGDTEKRQLGYARDYCKERGWTLNEAVDVLRDEGYSAYHAEHIEKGALGVLLRRIRAGEIPRGTVLVLEHLDRLSRQDPMEAMAMFNRIIKAGIILCTVMDRMEYSAETIRSNPYILLSSLSLMIGAHSESLNKAKRVAEAWVRKREAMLRGERFPGSCKAWLQWDAQQRKYIVIPQAIAVIRRIFEEAADGIGCYTIAIRLKDDPALTGNKTKYLRGRRVGEAVSRGWNKARVRQIIMDDSVLGYFQPHIRAKRYHELDEESPTERSDNRFRIPVGDPISDYYPAIIERSLVERARAQIASRRATSLSSGRYVKGAPRKIGIGRKGNDLPNLFQGIAVCAVCGDPMLLMHRGKDHISGKQRSGYLQCRKAVQSGECQNRTGVPYNRIEESILKEMEVFHAILTGSPRDSGLVRLQEEIAKNKAEAERVRLMIRRTLQAFGDEASDDEEIKHQMRDWRSRLEALKTDIANLQRRRLASLDKSSINVFEARDQLLEQMASDDPDIRFRARSQIATALRQTFPAIRCLPDRTWQVVMPKGGYKRSLLNLAKPLRESRSHNIRLGMVREYDKAPAFYSPPSQPRVSKSPRLLPQITLHYGADGTLIRVLKETV